MTSSEAQKFRDANGNYRTQIPPEEIEPFLYDEAAAAKRPSSILRSDPVAALCRDHGASDPLAPGSNGAGTMPPTGTGGGTQPPADQPITSQDLPRFIGRLVNAMVAPEQNSVCGKQIRPTTGDVQNSIQALQLGAGPADVTAFYDFHQLQIAFDYVWKHAIDEGILDTGKQLYRQLTDQGSDPLPFLQNGDDAVKVLRSEVRHVASAQRTLQAAGVAYRMAANTPPIDGNGMTQPPPPPPPPLPPINKPPFHGGMVQPGFINPGTFTSLSDPLAELDDMLSERYKFEVFAPGSSNFGLLVTYRQKWDPITYQVGNLVKTLTLAPKETRKVTSKRTIKRERSVKELEANQRNRKDETSLTMRDEAEIVRKAQDKTSFNLTAKGSYDIGISDGEASTTFSKQTRYRNQLQSNLHESGGRGEMTQDQVVVVGHIAVEYHSAWDLWHAGYIKLSHEEMEKLPILDL